MPGLMMLSYLASGNNGFYKTIRTIRVDVRVEEADGCPA